MDNLQSIKSDYECQPEKGMKIKKAFCLFLAMIFICSVFTSVPANAAYNSFGTAKNITLGSTVYGALNASNEQQFYKFTISSSGKCSFNCKNYTDGYWVGYYLYDASGNEIDDFDADYDDNFGYAKGSKNFYLLAGTYYLKADSYGNRYRYGSYTIDTAFKSAGESFAESYSKNNNYIGSANSISLNKNYKGQLGYDDEVDFYKFKLTSASKITITAKNYTDGYWVGYYLYDASGNCIDDFDADYDNNKNYAYLKKSINLASGIYYLKVSTGTGRQYGFYNFTVSKTVNTSVGAIKNFKVAARGVTKIKASWSKVSGASGYQVKRYMFSSSKWITLGTTTKTSYLYSDIDSGSQCKFYVRAYKKINGKYYFGKGAILVTCTKPNKVTLKSLSTAKNHTIKSKWTKVKGRATGYQIVYSRYSNFKKYCGKKTLSTRYTSYTGKNFTKNVTYYVKIRSYRTVNGNNYYSDWSNVKKIKCK